jgi:Tfp pilus assembly protein PilF
MGCLHGRYGRLRGRTLLVLLLTVLPGLARGQSLKLDVPLGELESRARQDSLDPAAHYNLAAGYMSKKRFPDAEKSLQAALAIDPRFASAQLALAVARERNEDYWDQLKGDSARRAGLNQTRLLYQRAFLIDPFVDVRLMALLFRVTGRNLYVDAIKAFVEGRYGESYVKMGKVIDDRPKNQPRDSAGVSLLWLHALSAVQVREYEVAETDIQGLIRLSSQPSKSDSIDSSPLDANEYRYMLAALKQKTGASAEAVKLYQEVLEQDVANYMAHVQLARIHEEAKNWPAAVAERQRAVDVHPDDASLLTDLGVTLGRSGDFNAAVEVLREASAKNPRDVRPLFWLGVAEMQLNNKEAARDAFTRFLAVAPSRQQQQITVAKEKLAALQ